uniref:BTB domain-containing protein n=1 Tax=Parastrongyloides trichosuri TaxID=131310 RepID=A0A0N4ZIK3_PARTI
MTCIVNSSIKCWSKNIYMYDFMWKFYSELEYADGGKIWTVVSCNRPVNRVFNKWSCNAILEIKAMNAEDRNKVYLNRTYYNTFSSSESDKVIKCVGIKTLLAEHDESFEKSNICVEFKIQVLDTDGIIPEIIYDYKQSIYGNGNDDTFLEIDGQLFSVKKNFLSMYGTIFQKMFNSHFKVSAMDLMYKVNENNYLFSEGIRYIYKYRSYLIHRRNVERLLALGKMCGSLHLIADCENFLINTKRCGFCRKMNLAEKYELQNLYLHCIHRMDSFNSNDLLKLLREIDYFYLSDGIKDRILDGIEDSTLKELQIT